MNYLKQFDQNYTTAKPESTAEVPDGVYSVEVTGCAVKLTKATQEPMLAWEFTIQEGDHAKRKFWKNSVIRENTLGYIKADLETVGLQLDAFSDLERRAEELVGLRLEVKKGKYTDINAVLAADDAEVPFS